MTRETAISLYNRAIELAPTDSATAYRFFSSSVEVDPTFAEGWYSIGNANSDMGKGEASVAAHRRAVALNPKDAKAWCNLGHTLHHLGRQDEAMFATEKAIAIEPTLGFAWCTLSLIQSVECELRESLTSAKRAFDLTPEPAVEMALGFAHLFAKDWASGLRHLESRFQYKLKHHLNYPYPRWDGSSLGTDKTLLILADQGMGDALSFMRFVPRLPGEKVILQVHPELVRVCAGMFADAPDVQVGPLTQALPDADYWCALSSLPTAMGLSNDEIAVAGRPLIKFHALGATVPWKVPGRKLHIGIVWAGAPDNGFDKWRSMQLEQFLEFYRVPGVQLYSLQVGPHAQDIHTTGSMALVRDLAPYIRDVADTGVIMRDLDLVISVESGPRHIAAAHGVECWVPMSRNGGDWRCGRTGDHPLWDARTRLFRQGRDARWEPVIEDMIDALKERVGV